MFDYEKVFIDYDGVLVNSDEVLKNYMKKNNLTWDNVFDNVNWSLFYSEAREINDSFNVMRLLQRKKSNIFVLTKIHSLVEAKVKINLLRENKIVVPVFVVPPHVKKSEICLPTETSLLIDDSQKNIDDWEDNGGIGFLFDGSENDLNGKKKVKSLHFLLK